MEKAETSNAVLHVQPVWQHPVCGSIGSYWRLKKGLAGAAGYLFLADIILTGGMSVLGTFSSQGVRPCFYSTRHK